MEIHEVMTESELDTIRYYDDYFFNKLVRKGGMVTSRYGSYPMIDYFVTKGKK